MIDGTMELFEHLPKVKGDKKVLRELAVLEQTLQVPKNFTFVQSLEQLKECVSAVQEHRQCVFDTETTGLDWSDYAVCLGIAVRTSKKAPDRAGIQAWIIPTDMQYAMRNFTKKELQDNLGAVFADPTIAKIGHSLKFDQRMVKNSYEIDTAGITDDTMIAQHILNENESHKLVDIAHTWLQIDGWKYKQDGHFNVWPLKVATTYLGRDVETTLLVHEWQQTIFAAHPELYRLYKEVEVPNIQIAYEMEMAGIGWDEHYYETVMKPAVQNARAAAQKRIHLITGPVNLDSPIQLANALFDGLHLDRIDGNCVDKKALVKLKKKYPLVEGQPLFADIQEYRKYSTLDKMFVKELPEHVHDGRVHCSIRTLGARTGRQSCSDPNLQQIPKAAIGPLIRKVFIPTKGHVFITMDYGQIELRILAHLSGDQRLIQAFESGEDIHTATCLLMFPNQITLEELKANKDHLLRTKSKVIGFGILYGMGEESLANTINAQARTDSEYITGADAKLLIVRYFTTYPAVKRFVSAMKVAAVSQGYVTTILGRKRRLPEARSADHRLAGMASRMASNAPIQGSAADLLKVAAIKIRDLIAQKHYPFKMLLAVHDELVLEVPEQWLRHNEAALHELSETMRTALTLKVPLAVSVDILRRWGDRIQDDNFYTEDV